MQSIRPALLACLSASLFLCAHAQEPTPGSQWLSVNNRLDSERFSPLKQITPENAAKLGEVCRVQVDGPTTFHAGLVVVDGVIYTATATETVALDATNCQVRWRHSYTPEEPRGSGSNRGVAVLDGRVFRGTGDDRLLALDAATGKLLWKDVIGTTRLGEGATAAPLAWAGVVYMGISGSEAGVRGRVMAFDAQTGRELWRFNTVPRGDEKGAETWQRPGTAKTGGGGVWGSMTLDVTTGELFVSVGNPWPDLDRAYRPGSNLFTDSIVVLDARTGALKWWYQAAPADWQDLDIVAAPVLYRDSQVRDVVAFGGKDGYITAVDRDTHKMIFRTPVTTIEGPYKGPTREGLRVCPGYAGGVEWNGPGLDTDQHTLVTGAVDGCFKVKLTSTKYGSGASFGGTVELDGPLTGWLTSVDMETGQVRWKYHAEKPVIAGVTPTAGGVTFTGDIAGNFLVFNSKTGEVVHKVKTGGALAGGVVTYEAGGKQYVAFASGNVSRLAFGALGLPNVVIMSLDPQHPPAVSQAGGSTGAGAASEPHAAASQALTPIAAAAPAGKPSLAGGRKLYSQVCASCHGPDGNLIADHHLSNLKSRRNVAQTLSFIKDPKPPMPKLFPDLLNEQNVRDVTSYLFEELAAK